MKYYDSKRTNEREYNSTLLSQVGKWGQHLFFNLILNFSHWIPYSLCLSLTTLCSFAFAISKELMADKSSFARAWFRHCSRRC